MALMIFQKAIFTQWEQNVQDLRYMFKEIETLM